MVNEWFIVYLACVPDYHLPRTVLAERELMRIRSISGLATVGLLCMASAASATPVSTLTPLISDGTDVYAIYLFSLAGDTLNLSEIGPDSVSNIFCNYRNFGKIF